MAYSFSPQPTSEPLSDRDIDCINALLRQLSPNAKPTTRLKLEEVITHGELFLVRTFPDGSPHEEQRKGRIVAMATLARYRTLAGGKAVLEDVVVDAACRGQGLGDGLMNIIINYANAMRLTVDLTSRDSREAAIALYKKHGFVQRDTNAFRFTPMRG